MLQNHIINLDLALLSDHHALMFTISNPREVITNITEAKYNWKDAKEEVFIEALYQELHKDLILYDMTIHQVLNRDCTHASNQELDDAVRLINTCMEHAAEKSIPTCRMCSRSKPWWNGALTTAFNEMRTARDMAKSYYQHFNCQSIIMNTEFKMLCKRALQLVKTSKRDYYNKLTEEANERNMWDFRKWMNRKWTYTSLVLSRGEGVEPAISHSDKCKILRTTLFPPQPQLTNEPPIDLEPRDEDMTYHEVTKREVHNMLFTAALMNAPRITGMTSKAYCWTWSIMEEELYHLVRLCTKMGYHPEDW